MNKLSSDSALDALSRMEQKVQKQEAVVEAYAELNKEQDLEKKYRKLEKQKSVDDELAALKAKLAKNED